MAKIFRFYRIVPTHVFYAVQTSFSSSVSLRLPPSPLGKANGAIANIVYSGIAKRNCLQLTLFFLKHLPQFNHIVIILNICFLWHKNLTKFRKIKRNYHLAFPSGEGGPRQWWMRRSKSVLHTKQKASFYFQDKELTRKFRTHQFKKCFYHWRKPPQLRPRMAYITFAKLIHHVSPSGKHITYNIKVQKIEKTPDLRP